MSSRRRRFVLRQPVVVDIGCNCRRPKLPSFFFTSPKPKPPKSPRSTTTSLCETSLTATTITSSTTTVNSSSSPSRYGDSASSPSPTFYLAESSNKTTAKSKRKSKCGVPAARKGVVEGSTAVVKESSDPFLDFRESMLQMIVEMEIFAWDDLRDLLRRFLDLNSPRHHHLILRAFAETWNAIFSSPSPSATAAASASAPTRRSW
ncbi:hypothetical protein Cni_G21513 [Canna indica]|uniref:Transcription repressor n=1 Tax=Canna indica TaxID=4628 RepID=A0AAQ3KV29_9LILI|nr:hypothetical protein Cni_G21513 [Canna indica]